MTEKTITFNDVPEAISSLIAKISRLENLISNVVSSIPDEIQWLDINALCEYLPDKPAKQTVYGWVCNKSIPYHKKGKKLQFLKNEIDQWLLSDGTEEEEPIEYNFIRKQRKIYK